VLILIIVISCNNTFALSFNDNISCEIVKITGIGQKYMFGYSKHSTWVLDRDTNFKIGDYALVIFKVNNIKDIYDDKIIKVVRIH
jgi:hypothetical protein